MEIKNYNGLYYVTDCGKIINSKGKHTKATLRDGYERVSLSKGGVRRSYSVHVTVSEHYLGDKPNDCIIHSHR